MAIRGGKGKPKPKPRNHRTGPRSDYRRVANWKPSFKRMWLVVSGPTGEILRKDVDCLQDAWLDIRYGVRPYKIIDQRCQHDDYFWQWDVEDEEGTQTIWTLYMEV
jgi:hypothetical protein